MCICWSSTVPLVVQKLRGYARIGQILTAFDERDKTMISKAITTVQVLSLLAVIASGLVFVLTGSNPDTFVTMMWVVIGAIGTYGSMVLLEKLFTSMGVI